MMRRGWDWGTGHELITSKRVVGSRSSTVVQGWLLALWDNAERSKGEWGQPHTQRHAAGRGYGGVFHISNSNKQVDQVERR